MSAPGMNAATFMKGKWEHGLFDLKIGCLVNWCCAPCSLSQIHKANGNQHFNEKIACVIACCGGGSCLLWHEGQTKKQDDEPVLMGVLKTGCCGVCYLHQQYKEMGDSVTVIDYTKSMIGNPSQMEMS
mmetsp:Transcript_94468/g.282010  ORF Transcript_94468/g.282010 Transcript_94468/m.282010 type:complete len:128 (-) Transcript_94468:179-562(-)